MGAFTRSLVGCTLVLLMHAFGVQAQQYRTRPISLIVAIPRGGAPDVAVRVKQRAVIDLLHVPYKGGSPA
ncbi:MAG: hypothetical protein M3Z31_05685 [Pseudomonadota bacterium]|nr:hypothetical protein [Pseudomonadota bacterium]